MQHLQKGGGGCTAGYGPGGCLTDWTGSVPDNIRLVPLGMGTPTRPDPSLTGNGVRQAAARAFAPGKFLHGGFQIGGGKVRPALLKEYNFCECTFPQKKVGEALFPAGANQQVNFRRPSVKDLCQPPAAGV